MGRERSIYNPVVHPKFPSLCTVGSMSPFQSARASQSAQAVVGLSEEQQLGLCLPQVTELQFEVAAMGLSSSRSMLELVGCRLL